MLMTTPFLGDPRALRAVETWFRTYPQQEQKGVLIHGRAGIGKTFLVTWLCAYYKVTLYTIDVTDTSTVRRSMVNIRNDQGLIATSNTARARVALMSDITGLHGNIVQEIRRGLRPSVPFFATYTTMRGTGTGTAVPSAYMCSDWLEVPMALPSPNAVYEFLLAQDAAVEHCRESAARTARTARQW